MVRPLQKIIFIPLMIIVAVFSYPTISKAYVSNVGGNAANLTSASGGSLFFDVQCTSGTKIEEVNFYLISVTSAQNVTVKFNGSTLTTITSLPTSGTYTLDFNDFDCIDATYLLEFDVTSAGQIRMRTIDSNTWVSTNIPTSFLDIRQASSTSLRPASIQYWSFPTATSNSGGGSIDFTETNFLLSLIALFLLFSTLILITVKTLRYMLNFKR